MQYFNRRSEPPPLWLQSEEAGQMRLVVAEHLRMAAENPEKAAQTDIPRFFVPPHSSLLTGLSRLFRGKCAFCETVGAAVVPYQFRPAAEALPLDKSGDSHLHYAWLGLAWENIYAICRACVPDRPDHFPVRGRRAPLPGRDALDRFLAEGIGLWRDYPPRERPLLMEPCVQLDYASHLRPFWTGEMVGTTDRGRATVEHFSLDRPELAVERHERYVSYFEAVLSGAAAGETPSSPFDFPSLEFGGSWYLLLRRLALIACGPGAKPTLSPARIAEVYEYLLRQPGGAAVLRAYMAETGGVGLVLTTPGRAPVARRQGPAPSSPAPRPVRLTKVRIENFKGLELLELPLPLSFGVSLLIFDLEVSGALLILGENAAGKSSLLEAIALALCGEAARNELRLDSRSFILDPAYMGDDTVEAPASARVTLSLPGDEALILDIDRRGFSVSAPPGILLPPVFAYGAFRHYLDERRRFTPAKSIRSLFRTGTVLSNPEEWLLRLNQRDFEMVVRALRDILTIEGEFEVIRRDPERRRCYIVTAVAGGAGGPKFVPTPLRVASSGFRSVLAMVCDLMQGLMNRRVNPHFETLKTARAIVLIDEIEAHLHPRWKMQIMSGLRKALPGVIFIATTHDPLCLRGLANGEVKVLQRVPRRAAQAATDMPQYVEALVDLPDVSQLTIEQLLTSDFFRMNSTDAPETERQLAQVADLLARRGRRETAGGDQPPPLSPDEEKTLARFDRDIADALPVGSTEIQRLVQEAVADYLRKRRNISAKRLKALHGRTRQRILRILEKTG